MKGFKCCICEKSFKDFGNNPRPFREEGQCCDECNLRYVIPARIIQLKNSKVIQ